VGDMKLVGKTLFSLKERCWNGRRGRKRLSRVGITPSLSETKALHRIRRNISIPRFRRRLLKTQCTIAISQDKVEVKEGTGR